MKGTGDKLAGLVIAVLLFFFFAWLVQLCYNYALTKMSDEKLPEISYWVAVVFCILVVLLGALFSPHATMMVPLSADKLSDNYGSGPMERSAEKLMGGKDIDLGLNF